jgi:hypothetical protein
MKQVTANIIATDDEEIANNSKLSALLMGGENAVVDALTSQLRQLEMEIEGMRSNAANAPTASSSHTVIKTVTDKIVSVLTDAMSRLRGDDDAELSTRCRAAINDLNKLNSLALSSLSTSNNNSNMLSSSLRRSFADEYFLANAKAGASSADAQAEIVALKQELEECREDLRHDEEIFGEKVRELKKARKQIKSLQDENSELLVRIEAMQADGEVFLCRIPCCCDGNVVCVQVIISQQVKNSSSEPSKEKCRHYQRMKRKWTWILAFKYLRQVSDSSTGSYSALALYVHVCLCVQSRTYPTLWMTWIRSREKRRSSWTRKSRLKRNTMPLTRKLKPKL